MRPSVVAVAHVESVRFLFCGLRQRFQSGFSLFELEPASRSAPSVLFGVQWPLALLPSVLFRKRVAGAFDSDACSCIHGPLEAGPVASASFGSLAHIAMVETCGFYLYGPPSHVVQELGAVVL